MVVLQIAAPRGVFAAAGLSQPVLVAIGALVVVLAIFLVFIMALRSNGDARKTASGLGFDAHQGPLGQPQAPASQPDYARQRQAMDHAAPWAQDAQMPGGRMPAAGPDNFASGGWGGMDDPAHTGGASPSAPRWNDRQQSDQAWWNEAPAQPAPSAWGPATNAAPNNAGWGGSAGETPSPWQNPSPWAQQQPPAAQSGQPQQGWNAAPASQGGAQGWGQQESGAGAWGQQDSGAGAWGQQESGAGAWGAAPSANAQPSWGANAAGAAGGAGMAAGGWGASPAAPPAPPSQGRGVESGFAAGFGEEDRTRTVRPQSSQRIGTLVVRQGKEPGRTFEVRKERMTIGRSRESDIFLEDLAVSRLHTIVGRDDSGRYFIHDENSANGTYVNGQRIADHVLEEGDEVQVGQTVLRFVQR